MAVWLLAACLPAGVVVPPPEAELTLRSAVVIERSSEAGTARTRAERLSLEPGELPRRTIREDTESRWLLYEESLESLGLEPGPFPSSNDPTRWLTPRRAIAFSDPLEGWQSHGVDALDEWARPFQHPYPCAERFRAQGYRPMELERVEDPPDGRHPAFTAMAVLDDTRVLLGSATGRFFRVTWPRGGASSIEPVQTSTLNYHLSAFRAGDTIHLGGTGARIARAPVAPLLGDPPRLVLEGERRLAERPDDLDHAIVSISGPPGDDRELFFMAEDTEVFHLEGDEPRTLGRLDPRSPPFDPLIDREARARQVAWVGARRAVAVWFQDELSTADPGPIELDADGARRASPFPRPLEGRRASATSVAFDAEQGLYVAQSYAEGTSTRARIYRRRPSSEDWEPFARLDIAVQSMVPLPSAVLAVGAALSLDARAGGGVLAHRGFEFSASAQDTRCLWFRPNGRQRLAISFGPDRWLSTGTTAPADPPWLFALER